MADKKNQSIYNEYGKAAKIYTARKVGGMSKLEKECLALDEEYSQKIADKKA